MSETTQTPGAWAEAWLAVQKKYMDAWLGMAHQMASTHYAPPSPGGAPGQALAQGLAFWAKMMTPALPLQGRGLSEKLAELGQGYLQMGEHLWRMLQGVQADVKAGADWQGALHKQLEALQESFTTSAGRADPSAGLATLWGMPLQHWRRLASSFSVLPGDVEKSLRGEGPLGPEALQRELRNVLSFPAFGYTREWQAQLQQWGHYWLEHTQALQAYESALSKVGVRAFELLSTKLLGMAKAGEVVDSVRAAYDLWIDCAEAAYAEVVCGEEFLRLQARLINTLMALKRHEQQMVEEVQAGLNVPTRRELDTTHARVQGLRRELRALQSQVKALGVEALHNQLDTLRAELRAQQSARAAPSPSGGQDKSPPAPRRKSASRKATSAKATPRKAASCKKATPRKRAGAHASATQGAARNKTEA